MVIQIIDCLSPSKAVDGLKELEKRSRFLIVLLKIIWDSNRDEDLRFEAAVYLKHHMERLWPQCDQKNWVRSHLLSATTQPTCERITVQLAMIVSSIVNEDTPREWPEFLPSLSVAVQSNDSSIQHRGLLFLRQTASDLASNAHTRLNSTCIMNDVMEVGNRLHEQLMVQLENNEIQAERTLRNLKLAQETTKSLIMSIDDENPEHQYREASRRISVFERKKDQMMEALKNCPAEMKEDLTNYYAQYQEMLCFLFEEDPLSIVPHIFTTLSLTKFFCFTKKEETLNQIKILNFKLMSSILNCKSYKPTENPGQPLSQQAAAIIEDFFDPDTVKYIFEKLIFDHLALTNSDLLLWDNNSEAFACESYDAEDDESYSDNCEFLFKSLFSEYQELLSPVLRNLKNENEAQVTYRKGLVKKDAVYRAVGLVYGDIYTEKDLDSWVYSNLEDELLSEEFDEISDFKIVRRRICLLMEQWATDSISENFRNKLCEMLLTKLRKSTDIVVKIATIRALKVVTEDFKRELEYRYVEQIFSTMQEEVNDFELKFELIKVLMSFIANVESYRGTTSSKMLQYLPTLLETINDEELQADIISILHEMVEGFGWITEIDNDIPRPLHKMCELLSTTLNDINIKLQLITVMMSFIANVEKFRGSVSSRILHYLPTLLETTNEEKLQREIISILLKIVFRNGTITDIHKDSDFNGPFNKTCEMLSMTLCKNTDIAVKLGVIRALEAVSGGFHSEQHHCYVQQIFSTMKDEENDFERKFELIKILMRYRHRRTISNELIHYLPTLLESTCDKKHQGKIISILQETLFGDHRIQSRQRNSWTF